MQDNFEDIVKKKFSGKSIDPPADVWSNIEKSLRFAKIIKIIKFIAVPSFLAIAVISTFFIINNTKLRNALKVQKSNVELIENRNVAHLHQKNQIVTVKINSKNNIANNNLDVHNIINIDSINKPENKNTIKSNDEDSNIISFIDISEKQGCLPMTVVLNTDTSIKNIQWMLNGEKISNSNQYILSLEKPGLYYIYLTQKIGDYNYTITDSIKAMQSPIADFSIPNDIEINKEIFIENNSQNSKSFEWLVDNKKISENENLVYKFLTSGSHKICLIAFSDICSDTIIKTVQIREPVENVVFPTAFKPSAYGSNGGYYDLKNTVDNDEVFRPFIYNVEVKSYNLRIFNKKGQLIYESNELMRGWDGYVNQKLVPIGVYIYSARFVLTNGKSIDKQGDITVIY